MFIKLNDVRKRWEGEPLFAKVTFIAGYGDKIGLIGKNGSGKTTLLRIIAGEEPQTSGLIVKDPPFVTVLYHEQVLVSDYQTVKDFIISSIPLLGKLKRELDREFNIELFGKYEQAGGFIIENKITQTLAKLSLSHLTEDTPIKQLSGGEKTRIQIAPIIIAKPDILLLDEPTNHLDIAGLEFLDNYIQQYKGIVITATHDKHFLETCTNRIIEIENEVILDVRGNYSAFLREKEQIQEKQIAEYKAKKWELEKLNKNLDHLQKSQYLAENHKVIIRHDNDKMGFDYLSEKAAKKFSRQAEVITHKIKNFESLQKPQENWKMRIRLENSDIKKVAFEMIGISKKYGDRNIFTNVSESFYSNEKVCLIGANGSGKTTLLKMLFDLEKSDSGNIRKNTTISLGYLSQDHLEIDERKTVLQDFLDDFPTNEGTARTYLHQFLFKEEDVFRPILSFSQGEKSKYAFAKMLFLKPGFLLLDEPTNYMDMDSKRIIEETLQSYEGGFLLATHDRSLIKAVNPDKILHVEKSTISALNEYNYH